MPALPTTARASARPSSLPLGQAPARPTLRSPYRLGSRPTSSGMTPTPAASIRSSTAFSAKWRSYRASMSSTKSTARMASTVPERDLEALHPACFGWALGCCGWNREEAEDVLQTVYLKVFDGRARFDGHSSLKTWLFAVIWRTAAERRRRQWLFDLISALAAAALRAARAGSRVHRRRFRDWRAAPRCAAKAVRATARITASGFLSGCHDRGGCHGPRHFRRKRAHPLP